MSTLVLDTITGKSTATTITIGSTPVVSASANSMTIRGEGSNQTSIQQGLCKQWIQLVDTGSISTADSFNVTGLTDNGTGDYSVTIANDMANANYSLGGMVTDYHIVDKNAASNGIGSQTNSAGAYTIACFRVASTDGSRTFLDENRVHVQVFGDLA